MNQIYFLILKFSSPMTFKSSLIRALFFSIFALSFAFCKKDSTGSYSTASNVSYEMTDAPSDDPNVQGVFVTVVAIKVNGTTISNFNKTTLDLTAYQRGTTKVIGNADLSAGTYSNITLVLDNGYDQYGAAPGCYVVTKSSGKKAIASAAATTEITLSGTFKSVDNQSSAAVIDFDIRKAIVYDGNSGYKFVTGSELTSSVRVVQKSESGVITGSTTNTSTNNSDKVIVYVYKKGTYTKSTEMQGQGSSNVQFKNAVSSCAVLNNSYELHFLESGDYELHFISYKANNSSGKLDVQGEFTANIIGGLNIGSLTVATSATVTANTTLGLIVP